VKGHANFVPKTPEGMVFTRTPQDVLHCGRYVDEGDSAGQPGRDALAPEDQSYGAESDPAAPATVSM
jgi:hypothetical protein